MTDPAYEGWALVEQMGFRKTIAKVREVEQFGTKMLRMDVPFFNDGVADPAGFITAGFAGGPSLYQVTPLDDETALVMARRQSDPRPVNPVTFRIEAPTSAPHRDFDSEPDEPDDDESF
jgi:hypothetical protein